MSLGVIFNFRLTALEGNINGVTILGIMDLEGTIVAEDYKRYGVSMAEEKEEEFNSSIGLRDK